MIGFARSGWLAGQAGQWICRMARRRRFVIRLCKGEIEMSYFKLFRNVPFGYLNKFI